MEIVGGTEVIVGSTVGVGVGVGVGVTAITHLLTFNASVGCCRNDNSNDTSGFPGLSTKIIHSRTIDVPYKRGLCLKSSLK